MQQVGLSNKAAADEKAERARREKQLAIAEERRLLEQARRRASRRGDDFRLVSSYLCGSVSKSRPKSRRRLPDTD